MVKEVQQGSAGNEAARAAADAANLGAWTVATPAPTGAAFSGQPWQGEQIDAALAHLRGGSREDEETKSIKRAALNNIDEAIANTRDPEALRLLHEAKRSIEGAHSREAVLAAVTSAQGAIASAASASASAGAGESTSQAQMNAMHRELYANDPEYRRQTDMIRTEADDRMAGSNRESRRMQELADRLGIRTPLDAQVDERRQQYESARQRGDDLEARRLEVELHRLEVEQSRLRQQEAQRQGNPAAAEQFGQRGQQAQTELQHSIEAMRRQYEIYIQARERQLAARGVDPETRRQQLAAEQQQFEREVTSLTESRDVGRIRRQAREYGESTERVTQAPATPGETPATAGHAAPAPTRPPVTRSASAALRATSGESIQSLAAASDGEEETSVVAVGQPAPATAARATQTAAMRQTPAEVAVTPAAAPATRNLEPAPATLAEVAAPPRHTTPAGNPSPGRAVT